MLFQSWIARFHDIPDTCVGVLPTVPQFVHSGWASTRIVQAFRVAYAVVLSAFSWERGWMKSRFRMVFGIVHKSR